MHMVPLESPEHLQSASEALAIAAVIRANINAIASDITLIGEIAIPRKGFLPEPMGDAIAISILNRKSQL